ncbi:MAG: hypothetical protein ACJAYG_002298 [Oceanicoccus sp.]|jgi:hypothetical protein
MSMLETLNNLIDDQRKTLRLYALGALLFFIGVGFIQGADKMMEPSLQQESYALLGLIVSGSGFSIAIGAQVILIIQRFKTMGEKR